MGHQCRPPHRPPYHQPMKSFVCMKRVDEFWKKAYESKVVRCGCHLVGTKKG